MWQQSRKNPRGNGGGSSVGQVRRREWHGPCEGFSWFDGWKDSADAALRFQLFSKLSVHNGCVNTVVWNESGRLLLSGSDDQSLVISDPFDPIQPVKARIPSGHRANIFSARFLPRTEDRYIVSCAGDGSVILTDVQREDTYGRYLYSCHVSTTYEVATIPEEPFTFLTCSEDGTVRWFDRRVKMCCVPCREDVIIECQKPVCALDVNRLRPFLLGIGCSDSTVRLYDLRKLDKPVTQSRGLLGLRSCCCLPSNAASQARRITSLDFSPDGNYILVSFSSDYVYIYDLNDFNSDRVNVPSLSGSPRQTPVKRVRLRGDWSDTGPQARPERQGPREPSNLVPEEAESSSSESDTRGRGATIMQRFSNLLTNWLERELGADETPAREAESENEDQEDSESPRAAEAESTVETAEPVEASSASEPPAEGMQESGPSSTENSLDDFSTRIDMRLNVATRGSCMSTFRVVVDPTESGEDESNTARGTSPPSAQDTAVDNRQQEQELPTVSADDTDRDSRRRRIVEEMEEIGRRRREQMAVELEQVLRQSPQHVCVGVFRGHRNARTMLKQACFWGRELVMSGSDCGHVFIWERKTGRVLLALEGDRHVVNCLQPHPTLPILVTSGIDYDVKLWAPTAPDFFQDSEKLRTLVERNEVMLKETRDTVTIPATFMIRMIASMNRIRQQRRRQQAEEGDDAVPNGSSE